jgi:hypothetical protein
MGDLGFDPLGLAPKDDPVAWKEMQTKELNNGRLAMIAIAAFTAGGCSVLFCCMLAALSNVGSVCR